MLGCSAVWASTQCVFQLPGPLPSALSTDKVSAAKPGCPGDCAHLRAKLLKIWYFQHEIPLQANGKP